MRKSLHEISEETVSRYSARYCRYGRDVRTLGWGTRDQQQYRFSQAVDAYGAIREASILDIGCGFGDLLGFLRSKGDFDGQYIGWDINEALIQEAVKRYADVPAVSFEVMDILQSPQVVEPVADVGVMLGLLNFNLGAAADNCAYSELMIRKASAFVKKALIVDFLSSYRDPGYPKEDFVFYHEPERMMSFALSLTDNVACKHDYAAIPQKEFMLVVYK